MARVLIVLAVLLCPLAASAQQVVETAGGRALGMGGAFTAVADDASAVHWNPAGLASGPPGGMTIGWVDFRSGNQDAPPEPGVSHRGSRLVAVGSLPLGVSYGRFTERWIAPSALGTHVDGLDISRYGVTIIQTLTPGLVIGSTLKYLRGTVISSPVIGETSRETLRDAADAEGRTTGKGDIDFGAMADLRRLRFGVTVRNMLQPRFEGVAGNSIQLLKQIRLGVAGLPGAGLTLAMDLDLDTVDLRDGPRRILAFGVEERFGRRMAVRGGVRRSLEGARRRVLTAGVSVSIRRNLWIDSHYAQGDLDADTGFGAALRAGF